MAEESEAQVPGDEDEISDDEFLQQDVEPTYPTVQRGRNRRCKTTGNKQKKLRSENPLRLSTSAPEVYKNENEDTTKTEKHRTRTSSAISEGDQTSGDGFTESEENALLFPFEETLLAPKEKLHSSPVLGAYSKPKEGRAIPSAFRQSSPMKLPRNLARKTSNVLRRGNTNIELLGERKRERKKIPSLEPASPVVRTLFHQFKKILGENESEVMKLLLVHADGNTCTEGTQLSLLAAVANLLLVPDQVVPTLPEMFLQNYIVHDIEHGFTPSEWKALSGKDPPDGRIYTGLTTQIKQMRWWHVAEIYLISLFSWSSSFRQAFREFVKKLEKSNQSSRKKHKILPLLSSFVSKLMATKEDFSFILIEIYSKIKDVLAKFTKISLVGILFRFTVEAIVAIMHNPRKWNLDIEITRETKKNLQSTAAVFYSCQFQPKFQCSNDIESGLVKNISDQLMTFVMFCTNPYNVKTSQKVMSWPDSKNSLVVLYNHLLQYFEAFWEFLTLNAPTVTCHFLSFALIGLEAVQAFDSSQKELASK